MSRRARWFLLRLWTTPPIAVVVGCNFWRGDNVAAGIAGAGWLLSTVAGVCVELNAWRAAYLRGLSDLSGVMLRGSVDELQSLGNRSPWDARVPPFVG